MRTLMTAGVTALAVFSGTGCYVASLAPYYSSASVILDAGLAGTWVDEEGEETWTIARADYPADSYSIRVLENADLFVFESGQASRKVSSVFTARLFTIDQSVFLDAQPEIDAGLEGAWMSTAGPSWWLLRPIMHVLFRISCEGDTLRLRAIDDHRFDALLHQQALETGRGNRAPSIAPVLLPHLHLSNDGETFDGPGGPSGANLVLTAPTLEIQAFIRAHLKEMFSDEEGVMHRRR